MVGPAADPCRCDVECGYVSSGTPVKRYSVSVVRERLADALDAAERGVPVIIERKGVRYRLTVEKATRPAKRRRPRIEVLDEDVAAGSWTWDLAQRGLAFKGGRRR